jgi:hypothetical protein
MIDCPSCTSTRADCRLQARTARRGQLECPHCRRHFVFIADQLVELDPAMSEGFDRLDPAASHFKRRNLLIAGDLADPFRDKDPQRAAADRRELDQLRARVPGGGSPS